MPKALITKAQKKVDTPFQVAVYKLCSQIPRGMISTYLEISNALRRQGIEAAPIAVGQALKRNPYAPMVPCHRVVSTGLSLGGYSGEMKSNRKIQLLAEENVEVTAGFKISKNKDEVFKDFQPINKDLKLNMESISSPLISPYFPKIEG